MIRVYIKKNQSDKYKRRLKSKAIIRKKIAGTAERPRLVVFKSHRHIYAQLVDDEAQKVLASSSSLKFSESKNGCDKALDVGKMMADIAQKKGIQKVVFDRNGYIYHGRIQSVADGARKAGLVF